MATKTRSHVANNRRFYTGVAIPPGEHLAEELQARDMTQRQLAATMGRPVQAVNEIIKGKRAITAETALQLEAALDLPAYLWLNLESRYRLTEARLAKQWGESKA